MSNPLISVIIPGYNIQNYVEKCLQSIKNQTYQNIEVILVDDGSTDRTGEIFDEFAKIDVRFKCIHQVNKGVSAARNLGLKVSKGEWICFVDGDDYLDINTFNDIMSVIANDKDIDAVMFEYCTVYSNDLICGHALKGEYGIITNDQAMSNIYNCMPFSCAKLYRRDLLGNIEYKTEIYRGEDTIFAVEVFRRAKKIYSTNKAYYYYVQTDGSAVRGGINERQLTGIEAFNWLLKFAENYYYQLYDQALINYINIMIEFYIEMKSENYMDLAKEDLILQQTKMYQKEVMHFVTGKQKVKFRLFYIWPQLFVKCVVIFRERKYRSNC